MLYFLSAPRSLGRVNSPAPGRDRAGVSAATHGTTVMWAVSCNKRYSNLRDHDDRGCRLLVLCSAVAVPREEEEEEEGQAKGCATGEERGEVQ